MSVGAGLYLCAVMMVVGCLCGLVYDVLRALEGPRRLPWIVIVLRDLVFWLVVACLVTFALMFTVDGQVRLVFAVSAVFGALLYFLGVSPIVFPPMKRAVAFIYRLSVSAVQRVVYVMGIPLRLAELGSRTAGNWVEGFTGYGARIAGFLGVPGSREQIKI